MYTTKSLFTRSKYEVNQTLSWKMLSDDQCEELVMTAFELLERTGADIHSAAAVELLQKAGCFVSGDRVRIPSAKLEWALRSAPSRVTLCDRNGKRAILMETDNVHYGPGFGSRLTLDLETEEIRQALKADVANTAGLCSALGNIDFAMAGCLPSDVPESSAELHCFEALAGGTAKPILQPVKNGAQAEAVIKMAETVKGGGDELRANPFLALYIAGDEPLSHNGDALDALMAAAGSGVPAAYVNNLVTGLTAPTEPAGALVVALANSLVGILVAQLVREGAPCIAGGFFTINDTRNGMIPFGAPEISMIGAGYANVLRYLRIPSIGFAGASDSKTTDAQMGLESAFSILHAGLAGTNMIYGSGLTESAAVLSPFLLVIADEVVGMTKRMMAGVEVSEEKLARGVIDTVQPGGHYLGEAHTMHHFRTEQFWPKLMNRSRIDDWIAAGSKTLGVRAAEKTRSILALGSGCPLPEGVAARLAEIISGFESDAGRSERG